MKKRYETATWGDGVLSVVVPFWGILIGLGALLFRKERRRGIIMICIGVVMLTLVILEILVAPKANAKGYHYHAPKITTYHAPRLYAPRSTVTVRGYVKRNGTLVMPSHRTSPNATRLDNWSSRPNVNPYTGKPGTKDPFAPPSSGG